MVAEFMCRTHFNLAFDKATHGQIVNKPAHIAEARNSLFLSSKSIIAASSFEKAPFKPSFEQSFTSNLCASHLKKPVRLKLASSRALTAARKLLLQFKLELEFRFGFKFRFKSESESKSEQLYPEALANHSQITSKI